MGMTRTQERLMSSARKTSGSECWDWTGQISNSGYGRLNMRDADGNVRMQSAHYVSYEAFVGPVPLDKLVKQTCNNRLCINPEHLEVFDPAAASTA